MFKKLLFYAIYILASTTIFAQTAPASTWVTQPPATIVSGTSYPLSCTYDAGDDGGDPITEYTVSGFVQFTISTKTTEGVYSWVAGTNVSGTGDTHSGTASTNWIIPSITPSSDLTDGTIHVMRIAWQNNQGAWQSSVEVPVTVESPGDALTWNPTSPTVNAAGTLDIPIQYSSDEEIAAGGIKFTLWVVQPSPWWHQWKAEYINTNALAAGVDVATTITITPPASISTNGVIWTTTELQTQDINSSGLTYRYEMRMQTGSDANFTPALPANTSLIVDESLTVEGKELHKNTKVYPSPTEGNLTISDLKGASTISVSNLVGVTIKTFASTNTIDISDLTPGVYIITTDNGLQRKIVKK